MILSYFYRRTQDYIIKDVIDAGVIRGGIFGFFAMFFATLIAQNLGAIAGLEGGLALIVATAIISALVIFITDPINPHEYYGIILTTLVVGGMVGWGIGLDQGLFPLGIPFAVFFLIGEEALFMLDTEPIGNNGKYFFTVQKKLEASIEFALVIGFYPYFVAAGSLASVIGGALNAIAKPIEIAVIVSALLVLLVMVNSLKYSFQRKKPNETEEEPPLEGNFL